MFTVREIAKELKVHPHTVYRWIYGGKLKAVKIDGILRVKSEDYRNFVEGGSVRGVSTIV